MKNNKIIIGVVIAVIILLLVGFMVVKGKSSSQTPTGTQTATDVIPTVDSSVLVSVDASADKHTITVTVDGIPAGSQSIDYELSYQTKQQGLQGLIGTIDASGGQKKQQKKITLGTCSSGTCVYHDVQGSIKVTLKFTGSYGERLFQKDFSI